MDKEIRAIILAAGHGKRMKSEIPKVLHEIFGETLLKYVYNTVNKIVDTTYFIVGHKSEIVEEYINKEFKKNIQTILQSPQRGTGDAVNKAYNYLEDYAGNVLVLCGDTPLIKESTIENFIKFHKKNSSDITVLTNEIENPYGYGRILRDENGKIVKIVEEKDANDEIKRIKEINGGIYCFNWKKIKDSFNNLKCNNNQGEYYLTDVIEWGITKNLNVNAFKIEDTNEILGVNSKKDLAIASKIINERTINKMMDQGVIIKDPSCVWISPFTEIEYDTVIYPNVYINGKNKIGKNCKIGPFAHIRGNVEIGDSVKIGNFVELKNAIVKSKTNICHLSYIGDTEVGNNVNIGAGTITANYNSKTKEKNKTKIGDGVSIGSNSVLVAPISLEKNSMIGALSVVTKDVKENSLYVTRSKERIVENYNN